MFGMEQKHKSRTFFCNRTKWVVFRQDIPDPLKLWADGPGNGIVAQAVLSVSGRSASLFRPQGALGSGPKPARGLPQTSQGTRPRTLPRFTLFQAALC